MFPTKADMFKLIVIEDRKLGTIIGAGSVILELKFIRNTGIAGHIEDIVVDKTYRGKNLGFRVIELLKELAYANDCYKVILDCEDHNQKFYEKCGFHRKGVEMACYRDGQKHFKQAPTYSLDFGGKLKGKVSNEVEMNRYKLVIKLLLCYISVITLFTARLIMNNNR